MGAHRASHTQFAHAPPQACFDAVRDFGSYPEWVSSVRSLEVLEDGTDPLVAFRVDARVRTIAYTLRYHFEPPRRAWWDYVEGDAASVEGECLFEPDGDGTRFTYRLAIDPGFFLPGPLRRMLVETVMKGFVSDLVARVEGR